MKVCRNTIVSNCKRIRMEAGRMAIKQRLLNKLESAYETLQKYGSCGLSSIVKESSRRLREADDLSRRGLVDIYDSEYKQIYNGVITALERVVSGKDKAEEKEIMTLCQELLLFLIQQVEREDNFKKEIVFLPYKASMWDSMESVWKAAVDDCEHAIAYVVPIPYCDRDPDRSAREWHCEVAGVPEYVPVLNFRQIDLETMHPDVIVIHNPYDGYNAVTSVDVKYYSKYLKKYTDKLVYIPYFVLEEIDPDDEEALEDIAHFIFHGEAVVNSNLTIVQSENMREAYIRLLEKYTNKDRAFWEKRILGLGSPKFDKVLSTRREDIQLPEGWRRIIEKPDGTRKKVILYNVRLAYLFEYKEKLLDKMEWVFQIFRERQNEIALLWRPHPLIEAMIKSQVPGVWGRYQKMVEQYRDEGWGIYDDSPDMHRAIAVSDGYYGDGSSFVELFQSAGKPVMLQNVKLREPLFEESV